MKKKITAVDILKEAQLIMSQRGKSYGDANELYENFAMRINLVLQKKLKAKVLPSEAARIMQEGKSARWDTGGYKRDHSIDGGNYYFIAGALHENEG